MSPTTDLMARRRDIGTNPTGVGDCEDLELSPVQTQVWDEYDEAVRERRDRLARRQLWFRLRRFFGQADVIFYCFLVFFTIAGGVVMTLLMYLLGLSIR